MSSELRRRIKEKVSAKFKGPRLHWRLSRCIVGLTGSAIPGRQPFHPEGAAMSANARTQMPIGEVMKVVQTGQVGRVMSVDDEWARIFPHKGPMVVLDIDSGRSCYSLCELDLPDHGFIHP